MTDLALIDLSSIFWSAWHATADKELNAAFDLTLATIRRHAAAHQYCAVCCDAPPYFRKELAPSYKSQRDRPEPNALDQLRRTKERIVSDGLLLWEAPGFEADDVISTACAIASSDAHGLSVTIVSADKDLTQLISPTVTQLKPDGKECFDEAAIVAKYGVEPYRMRDLLALVGDRSDNVFGAPGVGPKTAAKLLHDFEDVGTLLANLDRLPPSKVRDSLEANAAQVELALRLVTLRTDVPIDFDDIYAERATQRLTEETDMHDIDEDEQPSTPEAQDVPLPSPKADALAVAPPSNVHAVVQFDQGLQPGSLGAAYKLAKGMHESRLYTKFPNPEAIWAVIIRGREMGLGALTALESFHVIEGKPAASAHLLIARAKGHPDCEYFQYVGGDATFAEYETKNRRSPRPTRLKYTIEQARRAGLARNGSNWEKRPEEMLRKTAAVQLARIEYPEILQGAYAIEELGG